jgi:hypothetical protein
MIRVLHSSGGFGSLSWTQTEPNPPLLDRAAGERWVRLAFGRADRAQPTANLPAARMAVR